MNNWLTAVEKTEFVVSVKSSGNDFLYRHAMIARVVFYSKEEAERFTKELNALATIGFYAVCEKHIRIIHTYEETV